MVAYGSLENGRKWHFRIENTRIRTEFSGGQNFGGDTDVADAEWRHLVVVFPELGFEGDDIIHYVDGEIEPKLGGTSLEIDTAIDEADGAFPVHIGFAVGHAGRWFQGQIADVRIYDEALDQAAIQEIMSGADLGLPTEPGDFNSDGTIDTADFMIMADNFNSTFSLNESHSKGDFDLNGRIDLNDFFEFRMVLNNQPGIAGVPEPNTVWWLLMTGLICLRRAAASPPQVNGIPLP